MQGWSRIAAGGSSGGRAVCVLVCAITFMESVLVTVVVPLLPWWLSEEDDFTTSRLPAYADALNHTIHRGITDASGSVGRDAGFVLSVKALVSLMLARAGATLSGRAPASTLRLATAALAVATTLLVSGRVSLSRCVWSRALVGAGAACRAGSGAVLCQRAGGSRGRRLAGAGQLAATALGVLVGYPLGGVMLATRAVRGPFAAITLFLLLLLDHQRTTTFSYLWSIFLPFTNLLSLISIIQPYVDDEGGSVWQDKRHAVDNGHVKVNGYGEIEDMRHDRDMRMDGDRLRDAESGERVRQHNDADRVAEHAHTHTHVQVACLCVCGCALVAAALEPALPLHCATLQNQHDWWAGALWAPESCGYIVGALLAVRQYRVVSHRIVSRGVVSGRVALRRAAVALLFLAVASATMPLAQSVVCVCVWQALVGASAGAGSACSGVSLSRRRLARHAAALSASDAAANAIGPIVGGVVWAKFGFATLLSLLAVFNVAAALTMYWMLHTTETESKEEYSDSESEEDSDTSISLTPTEMQPLRPLGVGRYEKLHDADFNNFS